VPVALLLSAFLWLFSDHDRELIPLAQLMDAAARVAHGISIVPLAHKLRYVPVVTRAAVAGTLSARIPTLIDNGELERTAGVKLDHERSRIMICGNPEMVDDTRKHLTALGFAMSRRGKPAHMAVENYW
jgi:ferredoxin--NADP+ reductase